MYRVVLERTVERALKKLVSSERATLLRAMLTVLEATPRGFGKKIKKLVGIKHGYRLRVGDRRVLYGTVADDRATVRVFLIDRRDKAYR